MGNGNISNWDVSKVTTMANMGNHANKFNINLSSWDVSRVTYMNNMFRGFPDGHEFNQNIMSWDTSNVKTFFQMFSGSNSFNQNMCGWVQKIPNGIPTSSMFSLSGCPNKNN